jgi:enoyl-CoA hydratase
VPQQRLRSARLSAPPPGGVSAPDALDSAFASISRVAAEAMEGAGLFAGGAGRNVAAAV